MYKIEKHYKYTDEVEVFNNLTKEGAIELFEFYFRGLDSDYYGYDIKSCIELGHASFEDFYILLSRADF